jgi:hypothetical protein
MIVVGQGGSGIVARGDESQPQVEIERPLPRGRDAKGNLGRVRRFEVWRRNDATDARLRWRAKRQGFALMIASSVVSLLLLCGAWMLLRGH